MSVIVAGYFAYDTYKVVSEDDPDKIDETLAEGSDSATNKIEVNYNEYDIDKTLRFALAQKDAKFIQLYFYDSEVDCTTVGVFKATYKDMILLVKLPINALQSASGADTANTSAAKATATSLFDRDAGGNYLEITSVPDKKNSIKVEEKDGENLEGNMELTWANSRSVIGDFQVPVCTVP